MVVLRLKVWVVLVGFSLFLAARTQAGFIVDCIAGHHSVAVATPALAFRAAVTLRHGVFVQAPETAAPVTHVTDTETVGTEVVFAVLAVKPVVLVH